MCVCVCVCVFCITSVQLVEQGAKRRKRNRGQPTCRPDLEIRLRVPSDHWKRAHFVCNIPAAEKILVPVSSCGTTSTPLQLNVKNGAIKNNFISIKTHKIKGTHKLSFP